VTKTDAGKLSSRFPVVAQSSLRRQPVVRHRSFARSFAFRSFAFRSSLSSRPFPSSAFSRRFSVVAFQSRPFPVVQLSVVAFQSSFPVVLSSRPFQSSFQSSLSVVAFSPGSLSIVLSSRPFSRPFLIVDRFQSSFSSRHFQSRPFQSFLSVVLFQSSLSSRPFNRPFNRLSVFRRQSSLSVVPFQSGKLRRLKSFRSGR
jgi:hypothetical protein